MKKLMALIIMVSGLAHLGWSQKPNQGKNKDTLDKTYELSEVEFKLKTKNIVGYYAGWQMYDRGGLCKPENVNYDKYTILNYAFFRPDSLGYLKGTDPWGDSIL